MKKKVGAVDRRVELVVCYRCDFFLLQNLITGKDFTERLCKVVAYF